MMARPLNSSADFKNARERDIFERVLRGETIFTIANDLRIPWQRVQSLLHGVFVRFSEDGRLWKKYIHAED